MPSNESVKAGLAVAEDKAKLLGLTVGKHTVEPGLYIPRADARSAPELSFEVPNPEATYLVMGIDIDAPFVSMPVLGPILHWIQPGLKAETKDGKTVLTAKEPFVSDYIGPGPPPGSGPHRYCFFLYEQPAGFDGKAHAPPEGAKMGSFARMWFSLDDWEKKVGLGKIIAANYFTSN
ncbi:protease inhibitor (Tfs1) [Purpureocillium lavendulum]|uniref:Protease inhibitor (Tfs1) n=1 Tax=Purpureocillium lavendulum TaxID=1247861 RepID=A0AB34FTI4_9HYPO|nr:protease inhibitor (Tfs1) [Purpureocillium lavendulum]